MCCTKVVKSERNVEYTRQERSMGQEIDLDSLCKYFGLKNENLILNNISILLNSCSSIPFLLRTLKRRQLLNTGSIYKRHGCGVCGTKFQTETQRIICQVQCRETVKLARKWPRSGLDTNEEIFFCACGSGFYMQRLYFSHKKSCHFANKIPHGGGIVDSDSDSISSSDEMCLERPQIFRGSSSER